VTALNLQIVRDLLDTVGHVRKTQPRVRGYNVFRILGVEEKEVSMHSAFLAPLLDPLGTHGQGTLFLDSFLKEIGITRQASDWSCDKEWPIPDGRIDILLQSSADRVMVAIENKIYAPDEKTQLRRYHDWLDKPYREQRFPRRRLLFLTLEGRPSEQPTAQGVDYDCISYRQHVNGSLRNAHVKIDAVEVKNGAEQYLDTLKLLLGETSMEDPVEAKILTLAQQPSYLGAALAVARCGPKIVDALLRDFWAKGKKHLQEKLKKNGFGYWTLSESEKQPTESGYYLALVPQLAHDRPKVTVYFYQYRARTENLFRLERCVQFAGEEASEALSRRVNQLPETKALRGRLEESEMPSWHGWDAYQRITKDSKGIHNVLEEEAADGRYSALFFQDGWEWFVQLEEVFRKVDNAIAALVVKTAGGR
jgi:hypothetical protein